MDPTSKNRSTILSLLPYTPTGLILALSSARKSILVKETYAPGETWLMNRFNDSWSMMTFSTVVRGYECNECELMYAPHLGHHYLSR